jgi:hypothetical protein
MKSEIARPFLFPKFKEFVEARAACNRDFLRLIRKR